jgi:predicted outer membrane protein
MKITAMASVTYDTDEVLSELRRDYPEDSFDQEYAKTMIQGWIHDDFGSSLIEYTTIEEDEDAKD